MVLIKLGSKETIAINVFSILYKTYLSTNSSLLFLNFLFQRLGHTLNLIDQWLQCFNINYYNRNTMYYAKMQECFESIPQTLPEKQPDNYKNNYQTEIRTVGGACLLEKTNKKPPPIKRWKLRKI